MIHLTLASKRKTVKQPPYTYKPPTIIGNPPSTTTTPAKDTVFEEALRRDRIIRALAREVKYKVNDICKPFNPKLYEDYGEEIRVTGICDTYVKYGRNESWPKNDVPFIIHAQSLKTGAHFICTPEWLVPITK